MKITWFIKSPSLITTTSPFLVSYVGKFSMTNLWCSSRRCLVVALARQDDREKVDDSLWWLFDLSFLYVCIYIQSVSCNMFKSVLKSDLGACGWVWLMWYKYQQYNNFPFQAIHLYTFIGTLYTVHRIYIRFRLHEIL